MLDFGGGKSESEAKMTPWRHVDRSLKDHANFIAQPDAWEMYDGRLRPDKNKYEQRQVRDARRFVDQYGGAGGTMIDAGLGLIGGLGQAQDYYGGAMGADAVQMQDTQSMLQNAAMFADNPYLNSQIDAAASDVTRNLYENQMPGIAAASAGGGNLGSSRRGMLEGMANRDAAGRIQNIATQMRGNAYGQGVNYANQIAQQNANLNMQNRNMQMGAANQMAGMGNQGLSMAGQGQNLFQGQNAMMGNIGQRRYDRAQHGMDVASGQHYLGQQLPYMQAQAGMNTLLPAGTAFGTNTTQTPTPGMMGQMIGLASSLGGAYLAGGGAGGGK